MNFCKIFALLFFSLPATLFASGSAAPAINSASDRLYQFFSCTTDIDSASPMTCSAKCIPLFRRTLDYKVNQNINSVTEAIIVDGKTSSEVEFKECMISGIDQWRCRSESEMMGGIVRREITFESGFIRLNMSGSGGDQFYCALRK